MFIKNILDRSKYAAMRAHHLKLMGVSIDKNGHYDLLPLTNTNIAVIELHKYYWRMSSGGLSTIYSKLTAHSRT